MPSTLEVNLIQLMFPVFSLPYTLCAPETQGLNLMT